MKNWYRCTVCGDIHYGVLPPQICPTCMAKNAYIKITPLEAEVAQRFLVDADEIKRKASVTSKKELEELLASFTEDKEYQLNPDKNHLNLTLEGALANERETGLKYCPCKLQSDDLDYNLTLLCPCNFTAQDTYKEEGRCWCGLFIKRKLSK